MDPQVLAAGLVVLALLGVGGWLLILGPPPTSEAQTLEVPDVVGFTQEVAKEELSYTRGFEVDVETRTVAAEDVGDVVEQNPSAGTNLEEGSTVTIVVGTMDRKSGDIFKDDFSDASSRWPVRNGEEYGMEFADGGYRIYRSIPGYANVLVDEAPVGDAIIEVDATRTGNLPHDYSTWSITCRGLDIDNYYTMGIDTDGASFIGKVKNAKYEHLATGDSHSKPNTATHHIRADCNGSTLTLYVNGEKVAEAKDDEYKTGKFGLEVSTRTNRPPGIDVLFDNFRVSSP